MHLTNARVWLTGASSGIGEALVAPLVRRGARVAITARRRDRLDAIAARLAAEGRSTVLPVPVDVTDRGAVIDAAQRIEHAWGGIDLAIFNAGGSVDHDREAAAEGREAFRSATYTGTTALNYFSVVYGIEAVLPGMLAGLRPHCRGGEPGRLPCVSLGGVRRVESRRDSSDGRVALRGGGARRRRDGDQSGVREDAAHRSESIPHAVSSGGKRRGGENYPGTRAGKKGNPLPGGAVLADEDVEDPAVSGLRAHHQSTSSASSS